MKNIRFYQLLHLGRQPTGGIWTVEALAENISSSRAHVTQVLNNVPGRGHQTRRKLARLFKANFTYWRDLLLTLGWDENGNRLTGGDQAVNGVMSGAKPVSSSP